MTAAPNQKSLSKARFRLRLDRGDLLLEELDRALGYIERYRTGIKEFSTPLAASHPELRALLAETLKKCKLQWLDQDELSIVLSPPWGSGWL